MNPIYLRHGDEFWPMTQQPYETEDELQQLLANRPEVLAEALAGDEAGLGRWLLVRSEAGIADAEDSGDRWSLDLLFLDEDGIPTLVEVKRASDERARGAVVAQMLDYAANATSFWRVEQLQAWFEAQCAQHGSSGSVELQRVFDTADPAQYWETVRTNLAADRIRLVFVADVISAEVRGIVEFLNRQMTETEVVAVEVKQYVDADGERQTIVPRVIGQTEEARRVKRPGGTSSTFESAPRAFHELLAHMDGVAEELGLTVNRVPTGCDYRPPVLEAGAKFPSGVGVFGTGRGAQFNLSVFRELGAGRVADSLVRRLSDFAGAEKSPDWPYVPCELLVRDWERARRELIEPYFAERAKLAAAQD